MQIDDAPEVDNADRPSPELQRSDEQAEKQVRSFFSITQ